MFDGSKVKRTKRNFGRINVLLGNHLEISVIYGWQIITQISSNALFIFVFLCQISLGLMILVSEKVITIGTLFSCIEW